MANLEDPAVRYKLDFADRLRMLRLNRGMTQKQLYSAAGINHGSYPHYENGYVLPNAYTVVMLAKALNVSTDVLLGMEKI